MKSYGLQNGVGKSFFSHGTEHPRGVCVMVNPNSFFQVESVEIDQEGRFIEAKVEEDHSIVNIYAPTDYHQQPAFIRTLSQLLMSKTNLSKVIIAGDWNTGLSKLDKSGGLPWKETNYRDNPHERTKPHQHISYNSSEH